MKIISWLGRLFQNSIKNKFVALILKAINLALGKISTDLYAVVKDEVKKSEETGKSGWDKWQIAYDGIRKRLGGVSVPEYIISILIEVAVSEVDPKIP